MLTLVTDEAGFWIRDACGYTLFYFVPPFIFFGVVGIL